jgi:hypothetical protein
VLYDAKGKPRLTLDVAPNESGLPGLIMRGPKRDGQCCFEGDRGQPKRLLV